MPLQPEDYEVKVPHVCPRCETELEESVSLLARWGRGGYVWKCVGCGEFKKTDKNCFLRESEVVRKIIREGVMRCRNR